MPETLFRRVERLREQEKHKTTAELLEMWIERRQSAADWMVACDMEVRKLVYKMPPSAWGFAKVKIHHLDCGWESNLEVNGVLEPPTPAAPGSLPDFP